MGVLLLALAAVSVAFHGALLGFGGGEGRDGVNEGLQCEWGPGTQLRGRERLQRGVQRGLSASVTNPLEKLAHRGSIIA